MPLGRVGDSCKGCDGFNWRDRFRKEEPPNQRAALQQAEENHRAMKGLFLGLVTKDDRSGQPAESTAQSHHAQQPAFRQAALIGLCTALVDPHAEKGRGAEDGEPIEDKIFVHGAGFSGFVGDGKGASLCHVEWLA